LKIPVVKAHLEIVSDLKKLRKLAGRILEHEPEIFRILWTPFRKLTYLVTINKGIKSLTLSIAAPYVGYTTSRKHMIFLINNRILKMETMLAEVNENTWVRILPDQRFDEKNFLKELETLMKDTDVWLDRLRKELLAQAKSLGRKNLGRVLMMPWTGYREPRTESQLRRELSEAAFINSLLRKELMLSNKVLGVEKSVLYTYQPYVLAVSPEKKVILHVDGKRLKINRPLTHLLVNDRMFRSRIEELAY